MKPSTPRTKLQPHQCILLFAVSLFVSCGDQSITNKPASSSTPPAAEIPQAPRTYSDKNGYFAAFPPSGWIQKDFPSETIRSKVEFIEPKRADVNIRVIVGPTTTPSVSLDDLFAEVQGKITTALQPRFPNIRWSARKEKVAEIQAAVLSGSGSGLEQEIVQYVNNGLNYSIALNATSKRDFQTAEPTFRQFLSSFTMLEGGKSLSDSDRRAAQVARLKRLASLREQMGQLADALQLADEGLSIDPNDAGLKEIRQRLVSKR